MLNRIRRIIQGYPAQFWLLFVGLMISTIGSSMIWPFLMVYVSERLHLPLSTVTSLLTINSAMGIIFSFIVGPVTDKMGRKWVMVISLLVSGMVYLLYSRANSYLAFAGIMCMAGAFNPLYRVGADAMMADLIPQEKRTDAYSLLRMSNNVGVAIGPAVGGFIATTSYTLAFYLASIGMITYALLVIFQAKETLPQKAKEAGVRKVERLGGYDKVLRDKQFVLFCVMFTLTMISSTLIWVLLAVYAKQNFNVSESQYGLIPTTNAVMVITLQIWVTSMTKRRNPFKVLAFGGFLYALGVGSVAWGTGFWGFWVSIIIMTVGELIMTPTATTMVANLAPADMRGRYMSIYSLTWSVAQGIGPVLGGFLNDNISPIAIWYGGGIIGMISVLGFLMMYRSFSKDAGAKALNSAAGQ